MAPSSALPQAWGADWLNYSQGNLSADSSVLCREGHDPDSFKCAACLPDYWRSGFLCQPCLAGYTYAVPITTVVIFVGYITFVGFTILALTSREGSISGALPGSLLFFLQARCLSLLRLLW